MYVYKNDGKNPSLPYAVGYYEPGTNTFKVASRHSDAVAARRRVNYLNGGPVPRNLNADATDNGGW